MDDIGWIKVHRKIRSGFLYQDKREFSKYEAWLDLLMDANFKDNPWKVKGKEVLVKRGQTATSERSLATRWEWSRKKVLSFLDRLQKEGMITKESPGEYTLITITNYEEFQRQEGSSEGSTQGSSERASGTQANTGLEGNEGTSERASEGTSEGSQYKKIKKSNNLIDNNIPEGESEMEAEKVKAEATQIFDFYKEVFAGFFTKISFTPQRRKAVESRLKDGYSPKAIKMAIFNIRKSAYHCGENDGGKFYADLTLICRNATKVEEWMNYQPKKTAAGSNNKPSNFNNFQQRTYDFDKLEALMLNKDNYTTEEKERLLDEAKKVPGITDNPSFTEQLNQIRGGRDNE